MIADLKMPGMDGLTLIRQVKRIDADLPVIIITGFSTESAPSKRSISAWPAISRSRSAYRRCCRAKPSRPASALRRLTRHRVIQLSDLTKSFGDRTLLDHVTWQIGDGDRVGFCGPNGAGKTTLLKMLAGIDEPDSGASSSRRTLTIGYLPQDGLTHSGRTVFEEASSAFQPLLDMQGRDARHRASAWRRRVPQSEHDAMLVALQRAAGSLPARRRLQHGPAHRDRAARASASRPKTASVRARRSPAAGRCASRSPSCCSGARICCCSTSRRTISISRRATGSRSISARTLRRHPRLARPLLPRRGRDAHHRVSTCAS